MTSRIFIPRDAGALASAPTTSRRALRSRDERGLAVEIVRTGSRGLYWLEPLVEVETAERPRRLRPGDAARRRRHCSTPASSTASTHPLGVGLVEDIPLLKRRRG